MNNLLLPLRDLWELFYPKVCTACKYERPIKNDIFCLKCSLEIPFTDHHLIQKNELLTKFTGRVEILSANALFYFSKAGLIQRTIHALKYKNETYIGKHFGRLMGQRLIESNSTLADYIIPVPLHYKKKALRGYNQTMVIAKGMNEITGIPILENILTKVNHSESQTTKSRADRFQNVLDSFELKKNKNLEGKHILVVDDVFTTGATLEACAVKLQNYKNIKISVAVIAMAQ